MNRLILVEGIPGSGKTTLAKHIYKRMINAGYHVKQYSEGDLILQT